MSGRRWFLGFDGGGTHTRCAVVDEEGSVRGIGRSGPGNVHDVGIEALARHLREAADEALKRAGLPVDAPIAGAYLALASVQTETDRRMARAAGFLARLAPVERIGAEQDLRAAWAGGLALRSGIALISGTGSSVWGCRVARDAQGRLTVEREWQSGGFGPLLDDLGSAYDFGRRALVAFLRAYDGRAEPSALTRRIEDVLRADYRVEHPRDVLRLVQRGEAGRRLDRRGIASLGRIVTEEARNGDAAALAVVEDGARELALCVDTVAKKVGLEAPDVALTGSVAEDSFFRERLEAAIRAALPAARCVRRAWPQPVGAAALALEEAGLPVEGSRRERIDETAARAEAAAD